MSILFKNIKELIQVRKATLNFLTGKEMNHLPVLEDAYLIVNNGIIESYGLMSALPQASYDKVIDVTGQCLLPTWCDSHTHLVFADTREGEFADRINGLTYEEIANRGGGILNSAQKLQEKSEEELFVESQSRLDDLIQLGTGAIEIKSGYGLNLVAELKMLRVIERLKKSNAIPIKSTFLGAHAVPKDYASDKLGYVDYVIEEMMPVISKSKLADFIDVFCEKGYFDIQDTERIIQAGKRHQLGAKIHVNQFNAIGGVKVAINNDALSIDHLEVLTEEDLVAMKGSSTMPTSLPGCSFFLGLPYTPARSIIDNDLPLALASDYNPGSCPSGNMNFVLSLACIKMNLTPEEAINAATINGAYAMDVLDKVGSITKGKMANFIITKPINSYHILPYSYGNDLIDKVYIKGEEVTK